MQFWTKFYSQLGRPLPKVPVPFASLQLSDSFGQVAVCYSCRLQFCFLFFLFSIKSFVSAQRQGGSAEVEALS